MTDGERQDVANEAALEQTRKFFIQAHSLFKLIDELPISYESQCVIKDIRRGLQDLEPSYSAWAEANDKEADRQNAILTSRGD